MEPGELFYRMGYDGILELYYDSEENLFYDQCGIRVRDIFEVLTPNDIFLFKRNPKCNVFLHRKYPRILCEILTQSAYYPEDRMALYFIEEDNVFMDGEGDVVIDEIFEVISPNDLYLLKRNKENMVVRHRTEPGIIVELFWPEPEEYASRRCSSGISNYVDGFT